MDVLVTDATTTGGDTARLLLQGVPSPMMLRDLIRFRVREDVARHNANPAPRFSGLVRPSDAEADRNGYALSRRRRRLDWEVQAETAIQAFDRNGFFVFVGDHQVDDLDEELALADNDVVSFVRLVPLVGGARPSETAARGSLRGDGWLAGKTEPLDGSRCHRVLNLVLEARPSEGEGQCRMNPRSTR